MAVSNEARNVHTPVYNYVMPTSININEMVQHPLLDTNKKDSKKSIFDKVFAI